MLFSRFGVVIDRRMLVDCQPATVQGDGVPAPLDVFCGLLDDTDRQIDGQTDGQTGRQTDRQTDRQTAYRHAYRHTCRRMDGQTKQTEKARRCCRWITNNGEYSRIHIRPTEDTRAPLKEK